MARLSEYDATRRIRSQPWGSGITIVALPEWGQEADRLRSRDAGCDGHPVKPVSLAELELTAASLSQRLSGSLQGSGASPGSVRCC